MPVSTCSIMHCSRYCTQSTALCGMCLLPDAMSSAPLPKWQPHHMCSELALARKFKSPRSEWFFFLWRMLDKQIITTKLRLHSRLSYLLRSFRRTHGPAAPFAPSSLTFQPPEATMREVISIHIGQAGIQVRVAAFLSRPHLCPCSLPLASAAGRKRLLGAVLVSQQTELPS